MTIAEPVEAPNYHRVVPRNGSSNGNGGDPAVREPNAQARGRVRARRSITLAAVLSTLAVPFQGFAARRRKARPDRTVPASWASGPPSLGALADQTRREWADRHGRVLADGESWVWRDLAAVLHALFGFAVRVPGAVVGYALAWTFQEEYRVVALLVVVWFWL